MSGSYSQLKAMTAIARASLIATWRSPTSVVFALLFPLIFVTVFGAMVDSAAVKVKIGISPGADTTGPMYKAVEKIGLFDLQRGKETAAMTEDLKKGRLDGILDIRTDTVSFGVPHYTFRLQHSEATVSRLPLIRAALEALTTRINQRAFPLAPSVASLQISRVPGRIYRQIDFILPGQLGFSLLMAGVFGSAFLWFNLRETLVLKRLFVTPVRRPYLIAGEMLSRLFFQVMCFIIIVAVGRFGFHFTLVHGLWTFLEMLLVSLFGLIIFTGTGFIISRMIKNESSIAPVANTLTVPQILLCGLFFPVEQYPAWLQSFCHLLPLTFFVDSLRKIAFEGLHIWQMPLELTGLVAWTLLVAVVTVRVFRWE
ncbi:ABC transporter permease [Compostibacter hankyongensis]|uniref:Transport permease protein n=1 Tax=Compostibacter hankyongensis TaxID=1007089 RepID=A0ABP8FVL1_9BACT